MQYNENKFNVGEISVKVQKNSF